MHSSDTDEYGEDPLLDVRGINVQFPRMSVPALDSIDFSVRAGEFVSLIGPSGCGKTSLLRVVGGLLSPDEGTVLLRGEPSAAPSPEKAFVFQHFNLFPWRTALENAAYVLEIQKVAKAERRERARKALALVGLSGFEDHYPSELSGGMKQRVGIARCLTMEPTLLLMDEPFGAVDALTRERLQIELSRICSESNLTTLFVTHSIDEAIFLSDRILVMGTHPGRIIDEASVPIPRPRDPQIVRQSEDVTEVRGKLWDRLQSEDI